MDSIDRAPQTATLSAEKVTAALQKEILGNAYTFGLEPRKLFVAADGTTIGLRPKSGDNGYDNLPVRFNPDGTITPINLRDIAGEFTEYSARSSMQAVFTTPAPAPQTPEKNPAIAAAAAELAALTQQIQAAAAALAEKQGELQGTNAAIAAAQQKVTALHQQRKAAAPATATPHLPPTRLAEIPGTAELAAQLAVLAGLEARAAELKSTTLAASIRSNLAAAQSPDELARLIRKANRDVAGQITDAEAEIAELERQLAGFDTRSKSKSAAVEQATAAKLEFAAAANNDTAETRRVQLETIEQAKHADIKRRIIAVAAALPAGEPLSRAAVKKHDQGLFNKLCPLSEHSLRYYLGDDAGRILAAHPWTDNLNVWRAQQKRAAGAAATPATPITRPTAEHAKEGPQPSLANKLAAVFAGLTPDELISGGAIQRANPGLYQHLLKKRLLDAAGMRQILGDAAEALLQQHPWTDTPLPKLSAADRADKSEAEQHALQVARAREIWQLEQLGMAGRIERIFAQLAPGEPLLPAAVRQHDPDLFHRLDRYGKLNKKELASHLGAARASELFAEHPWIQDGRTWPALQRKIAAISPRIGAMLDLARDQGPTDLTRVAERIERDLAALPELADLSPDARYRFALRASGEAGAALLARYPTIQSVVAAAAEQLTSPARAETETTAPTAAAEPPVRHPIQANAPVPASENVVAAIEAKEIEGLHELGAQLIAALVPITRRELPDRALAMQTKEAVFDFAKKNNLAPIAAYRAALELHGDAGLAILEIDEGLGTLAKAANGEYRIIAPVTAPAPQLAAPSAPKAAARAARAEQPNSAEIPAAEVATRLEAALRAIPADQPLSTGAIRANDTKLYQQLKNNGQLTAEAIQAILGDRFAQIKKDRKAAAQKPAGEINAVPNTNINPVEAAATEATELVAALQPVAAESMTQAKTRTPQPVRGPNQTKLKNNEVRAAMLREQLPSHIRELTQLAAERSPRDRERTIGDFARIIWKVGPKASDLELSISIKRGHDAAAHAAKEILDSVDTQVELAQVFWRVELRTQHFFESGSRHPSDTTIASIQLKKSAVPKPAAIEPAADAPAAAVRPDTRGQTAAVLAPAPAPATPQPLPREVKAHGKTMTRPSDLNDTQWALAVDFFQKDGGVLSLDTILATARGRFAGSFGSTSEADRKRQVRENK